MARLHALNLTTALATRKLESMIPANFDGSNVQFGPPDGMTEDDCQTLFGWRGVASDGKTYVVSRWKLTKEEVEALLAGGSVWLWAMGNSMPPVILTVTEPPPVEPKDG